MSSGAGLERFRQIIEQQGGDPHVIDDYDRLSSAKHRHVIKAHRSGVITRLDAYHIGVASMLLGAGRSTVDDVIDPAVGIRLLRKVGDEVKAGDAIKELHFNDESRLPHAMPLVERALEIDDEVESMELILEVLE